MYSGPGLMHIQLHKVGSGCCLTKEIVHHSFLLYLYISISVF